MHITTFWITHHDKAKVIKASILVAFAHTVFAVNPG